jgi:CheY-like chemotaxis protein
MKSNLRILLLEDSLADAKLIERELLRDGFSFTLSRVQTETELHSELALAQPDLVLSNHLLPRLDGFTALAIVRQAFPAVPFIFVSALNDQQMVCDMFEEGASDFIFKRDLADLAFAVTKATGVQPDPALAAAVPEQLSAEFLPQLSIPGSGALVLCPRCHQARDESGKVVTLADYCFHRAESVVTRQICDECARTPAPAPMEKPATTDKKAAPAAKKGMVAV